MAVFLGDKSFCCMHKVVTEILHLRVMNESMGTIPRIQQGYRRWAITI